MPWRRIPIFVAAVVCLVAALWGSLLLNGVGRRTLARSLALASLIGSPVVVLLATALPVS